MKNFYVIWQDFNKQKFEPYNIMPYFIREYNEAEVKPKTFKEFKAFVERKSMYMYWSRCEYEVILAGWPNIDTKEKWDIHKQIMMNIDVITEILIENIHNGDDSEESN